MDFAKALKLKTKRYDGYLESDSWIITWCVGHLVTMSYPEKYDESYKKWSLKNLPFIPDVWKYEIINSSRKQFKIVEKLLKRKDINIIYNAGDAGREGEYIQRLVLQEAKPNPNAKILRVWIDSQTDDEILRGIKEAKESKFYDSLADSAYLRAKEDYLIGINFSRLFSIKYGNYLANKIGENFSSISIGRVMTCVLGMIASRELEILNFKKTLYYKVVGKTKDNIFFEWNVNEKSKYYNSPNLYNDNGFLEEKTAKELIDHISSKKAKVLEVKKSKTKQNPPLLYNLAEIQNEASKLFKIKPDETLSIIQSLYEKKLVTYPRTDARVLSSAVAKQITKNLNGLYKISDKEIKDILDEIKNEKYKTNLIGTRYVDDKKITDHYAIIPTGEVKNLEKLNELENNLYKLIVKRFLSIFYPPAQFEKINIKVEVDSEIFNSSSKILIDQGYLKNYKNSDNNYIKNINVYNTIKKGNLIDFSYEIKNAQTSPPSRYSSGSLILAMENAGKLIEDEQLREQIKGSGIGTSATRAEIIKKLEKIKYIKINPKTQIVTPTEKGLCIYNIVLNKSSDLLNPQLTASWEKGLDMVAKSQIDKDVFMDKLINYINYKFLKVKGEVK